MKNKFLPLSIFILSLFTSVNVFSQSRKFFAVTGEQFGNVNWMVFRQMDLDEKTPVKTLYLPAETNETMIDALTGKTLISDNSNVVAPSSSQQTCGCLNKRMVAAIAFDAKNNRLYYTQMLGNQLRYLDLNSSQPKSYAITSQLLKNFPAQPGEASVITRMCIAADNYGYALTNDNTHLIRFSTGKQVTITDLGALSDATSNKENSVKEQFKSWGGDLIADAKGNLYLFAMQRGIFKINPNTRLATYLGQIKDIPEDYTINAAMVEDAGNVIVGSSTKTSAYYRVNLNTLQATALNKRADKVYNVSDFANANFAFNSPNNDALAKTLVSNKVNIYPNPVNYSKLNVQFTNFTSGKYVIQLGEMEGKTILQKEVKLSGSQTESLKVSSVTAGMYLVRILNEKGEAIYTDKVIISR
jgi:hypothetical protein